MTKRFSWWDEELTLLKPPEDLSVSMVADKYRILGRGSSKPGRWETSFLPFMQDIMDSFAIDSIEEIWFVKPSQTGGTEALLNMTLYAAIQDPGPLMLIEPTENLADEISQERLDLMIQTTPELRETQSPDTDPTKKKKVFQSMTVYLAWSNSPTSLASRPIRYCFFDETNKYRRFSGEEASPLALGRERTNTFIHNRKLVYISTPTTDVGYITKGEESCVARFRYQVPCPHCGYKQILSFEQVMFSEFKDDLKQVEERSFYQCESCRGKIFNDAKSAMVRNGKWFDLNSELEFSECIEKLRPKRIGFQINRLYSPWHSFGMVAREFLESKDYPEKLMNWRNSWMAEPWIDRLETKSEKEIMRNLIDVPGGYVPKDYIALTAGVDPSDDGFYLVVLAWKRDLSCHLVGYDCLEKWDQIRELVFDLSVPCEGSNNRMQIWRCLVDSGGTKKSDDDTSMTEACYDFIRKNSRNQIFAAKGTSHPMPQKVFIKPVERTAKGPIRGGVVLIFIDSSAFKDAIHYRLDRPPGEPGRFTFNKETEMDYISHLFAEERRRNARTGLTQWVQVRKSNHFLDATCLAFACADPSFTGGITRFREPSREATGSVASPEPTKSSWMQGYTW
jgi:phage terminase large subunit GpA-like protein